jgi:hypothetical protein
MINRDSLSLLRTTIITLIQLEQVADQPTSIVLFDVNKNGFSLFYSLILIILLINRIQTDPPLLSSQKINNRLTTGGNTPYDNDQWEEKQCYEKKLSLSLPSFSMSDSLQMFN